MFSGHTDVAGRSLLQTAAGRLTVDRSNDRFVEVEQQREKLVLRLLAGFLDIVGLDIAAGGEGALSAPGENADAQAGIIAKFLPDLGQPFVGFEVTGIQSLRSVDRDV